MPLRAMKKHGFPEAGRRLRSAPPLFVYGTPSTNRALRMTALVQPQHDLSPVEIDAIENCLHDYNRRATGRSDGRGLGFVIRDEAGRTIGAATGYSWAGTSEIKQLWIDEAYRGRGYARALLNALVAEAARRGVRRIWVSSYDFQAPGLYEKAGFERVAEFTGWPEGHSNVILCKTLSAR
jgi:ribosomal protein S18 acetylase RimI-like enzyme